VLLHIYLFLEEDSSRALSLAGELANGFPSIPRYRYFEGLAYLRIGMDFRVPGHRGFHATRFRKVRIVGQGRPLDPADPLPGSGARPLQGSHKGGRIKLDTLLSMADPVSDPAMVAWPVLKIGMSYDLEGQREKALEHYTRVLEMKNGAGAQFLAQKYAQNPVQPKDPFIGY